MPTRLSIPFNAKKAPPTMMMWADTSRGLNMVAEGLDVKAQHVPDCLNVDWLPGGGWQQRGAVVAISTDAMPGDAHKMVMFTTAADQSYLVTIGNAWARYQNGAGQATVQLYSGLAECDAVEVNYRLYLSDGTNAVRWWNGTDAIATLGTTFATGTDASYSPTSGHMPKCKFMAVWHGRFWALHTNESSTVHGCRVRSSVPLLNGQGDQAWLEAQYVDLDMGKDGGNITGCAVAGGGFYIFKNHHTYEVTGWDWDTTGNNLFKFTPMDTKMGAVSNKAIAVHGQNAYFWDARVGACRITENTNTMARVMYVENIMAPIEPLLSLKRIPDSRMSEVAVGVVGDRAFFTVPWEDGTKRTLVFDILLGTWTMYDIAMNAYGDFRPTSGVAFYVGQDDHAGRVVSLGRSEDRDVFSESETADIASYVVSPWLHADNPSQNKVWSCMEITADAQGSFDVSVSKNWDRDDVSTVTNRAVGSAGPIDHGGVRGLKIPGRPEAKAISFKVAAAGPTPFKKYKVYGVAAKFEGSDRYC